MRARRKDANHNEVADYLLGLGWSFLDTSALGRGFPDGVAGRGGERGFAALVEIKNGAKPPSARKLTKPQQDMRALWRGPYVMATSPEDAARQLLALWQGWKS